MPGQFGYWNYDAENTRLVHGQNGDEIRFAGEADEPVSASGLSVDRPGQWYRLDYKDESGISPILIRRYADWTILAYIKPEIVCLAVDYVSSVALEREITGRSLLQDNGLRWLRVDRYLTDALCSTDGLWFPDHRELRLHGGWVNGRWQNEFHRAIWDYYDPSQEFRDSIDDNPALSFDDYLLDRWKYYPKETGPRSKFLNYDFGLYPVFMNEKHNKILQIRPPAGKSLPCKIRHVGTGAHYYCTLFYESDEYITIPIYFSGEFGFNRRMPPLWRFNPCATEDTMDQYRSIKIKPEHFMSSYYNEIELDDQLKLKIGKENGIFEPKKDKWSDFETLFSGALLEHPLIRSDEVSAEETIGRTEFIIFDNYNFCGSVLKGSRAYTYNLDAFKKRIKSKIPREPPVENLRVRTYEPGLLKYIKWTNWE